MFHCPPKTRRPTPPPYRTEPRSCAGIAGRRATLRSAKASSARTPSRGQPRRENTTACACEVRRHGPSPLGRRRGSHREKRQDEQDVELGAMGASAMGAALEAGHLQPLGRHHLAREWSVCRCCPVRAELLLQSVFAMSQNPEGPPKLAMTTTTTSAERRIRLAEKLELIPTPEDQMPCRRHVRKVSKEKTRHRTTSGWFPAGQWNRSEVWQVGTRPRMRGTGRPRSPVFQGTGRAAASAHRDRERGGSLRSGPVQRLGQSRQQVRLPRRAERAVVKAEQAGPQVGRPVTDACRRCAFFFLFANPEAPKGCKAVRASPPADRSQPARSGRPAAPPMANRSAAAVERSAGTARQRARSRPLVTLRTLATARPAGLRIALRA